MVLEHLYHIDQILGRQTGDLFRFCLNHHADESFRAARTHENAALAVQLFLLLRDGVAQRVRRHDALLHAALM